MVTIDAILLAGGSGRRFLDVSLGNSSPLPKQFQMMGFEPVFVHAARALLSLDCLRQIVFVVPKQYEALAREQIEKYLSPETKVPLLVVAGGERRQDSSRIALETLEQGGSLPARVLIHDACRPYLAQVFLERIKKSLFDRSYGAWVPVVPVIETLKRVENNQVVETVDRTQVHRVQTPQVFEYSVIRSLVQKTDELSDLNFTDDASLCEYYGIPVGVFEGDVRNIKLTYEFEMDALNPMVTGQKDSTCAPASVTTSIA